MLASRVLTLWHDKKSTFFEVFTPELSGTLDFLDHSTPFGFLVELGAEGIQVDGVRAVGRTGLEPVTDGL